MTEIDPLEQDGIFSAIGRFTVSWARIELGLDATIELMHHGWGGIKIEPEKPRALKRKLSYLRKVWKRLDPPDELLLPLLTHLDQIETASDTRHDIIHGIAVSLPGFPSEMTFLRILNKKGNVSQRKVTMNELEILDEVTKVMKLATETFELVAIMNEGFRGSGPQGDAQNQS